MEPSSEQAVLRLLVEVCGTPDILTERDTDLFEAGLIDSLGFVELLVGLEDELGLSVPPTAVDRAEVSTVNDLLAFVGQRL